MNKTHVTEVNRFVPEAVDLAMRECADPDPAGRTGRDHADFDLHYLKKMNELTIAAGLRIPMERLFEMRDKGLSVRESQFKKPITVYEED
jgi:hypothetical protein